MMRPYRPSKGKLQLGAENEYAPPDAMLVQGLYETEDAAQQAHGSAKPKLG